MRVKVEWLQDTHYCFNEGPTRARKKGEEDIMEVGEARGLEISGMLKIKGGVKSSKDWDEVKDFDEEEKT